MIATPIWAPWSNFTSLAAEAIFTDAPCIILAYTMGPAVSWAKLGCAIIATPANVAHTCTVYASTILATIARLLVTRFSRKLGVAGTLQCVSIAYTIA